MASSSPQPSPSTSTSSYYCSYGICTSNCLQFCTPADIGYYLAPPPPIFSDESPSRVSPLMIALISILAAAFLLLSYYTFAYKYCKRRRPRNHALDHERLQMRIHSSIQSNAGLDDHFITAITVFKYSKGDGLVESTDCAVCLTEFKEDESLRLMPNCQHAFHPPCIDTWLRSHANCPICRAGMIGAPPPPVVVLSRMRAQRAGDVVVVVDDGGRHSVAEGEKGDPLRLMSS